MSISSRIHDSIEDWIADWRDRLRGWMASWIVRGINEELESLEPEGIDLVRDNLAKVLDHPATPQDLKDIIGKLTAGTKPLPLLVLIPLAALLFVPTITSIFQPLGNLIRYGQERIFRSGRLDPVTAIRAFWRGHMTDERMRDTLVDYGFDEKDIETLLKVTKFYPAPPDLIRWQAREVFEPEMIARYGLDAEFGAIEKEPFYKAGMTDEQILNYWRAHWEHASFIQVIEMLHRGLLSLDKTMKAPPTTAAGWDDRDVEGEAALYDWYRLVEIPPFWRARLTAMSWNVPTRVDVRRWWDLRTIDEAELRNVYHRQGYHGKDLDNYVLWTKVYVAFPDLLSRWTNGWITEGEVRGELVALGMPAARVNELMQTKIKNTQVGRVTTERDLTKTDIIKGVKNEVISWAQGIELLLDLGYSEDEADYILVINISAMTGSPESFAEFKDITTKYKLAVGREAKPMPEELKAAAAEVVRLSNEVKSLELSIAEEKRGLVDDEVIPEPAARRLKKLGVSLHRAESELARVKSEYDRLVAEWRHGLP